MAALEIWYFQCWKMITPRMKVLVSVACFVGGFALARWSGGYSIAPLVLPANVQRAIDHPRMPEIDVDVRPKPQSLFAGKNDPYATQWRQAYDVMWTARHEKLWHPAPKYTTQPQGE